MHNSLDRTAFRIQALAFVELGILSLILILGTLVFPHLLLLFVALCGIGMLAAGAIYWLRQSAIIEPIIYANIMTMIVLLVIVDPLSGTLSGSTWTLYQIWPLVVALILRNLRSTAIVVVITLAILVTSAWLQISGVIPVELMVRPDLLWFNLGIQILVMIMMSSIISVITADEQRSYEAVSRLGAARERQLAENQVLLDQQGQLNQELRASLDQIHLREAQLRDEQTLNQELLRTVDALAAPIIPISDEVVVAPLVGSFHQERLAALAGGLLEQIARRHTRVLILDVTGLAAFDTATAQALMATVDSCRLMGIQAMLVGIQPEMA
ncbi:STAS domain-containing protein [Oscillochloris sp. ZM17-4]|uniref:STAS domain-containing protein n=1 Tax=Oscillochloris sp. ZM17-4 TaxID=2866714 RepID=UPI001C735A10|nr:STAS domain-containing protein [Oscillochloris sp. ZM17-4]MBX0327479.1 STAS domain-containing protein [Oscillochloris sp. ZM17-4]